MHISNAYKKNGYAYLPQVFSPEICHAVMCSLSSQLASRPIDLSHEEHVPPVLQRAAFDVYGPYFTPLKFMLWGLTPFMRNMTGNNLAPSYNFFRIYRQGDVCRVHSDRPSCDHSVSLTLGYSEGSKWALDVATTPSLKRKSISDTFGAEPFSSIEMNVGDAVAYRGVEMRHGRMTPNPNTWSAHMFLHWVDLDGPYKEFAFEGDDLTKSVKIQIA